MAIYETLKRLLQTLPFQESAPRSEVAKLRASLI